MGADCIVDTGAMLALLDPRDVWHGRCAAAFTSLRFPLLKSAVVLGSIADHELPAVHALMSRYADRPMDFADATLVYLARREAIHTIFTVDRSDFETYRIEGRRRFRIVPEQ
jgi:predicted nucleic acid-binding protein